MASRSHVHDPRPTPRKRAHEYGVELVAVGGPAAAPTRSSSRSRTGSCSAPLTDFSRKLRAGGCFIDVKCSARPRGRDRAGPAYWRL